MLILICDAFDPSLPEKLRRFGEVTEDGSRLPEAEVALVRSKTKCTAEWMAQARKLKLIIRGGVGMDNIDLEAAKARGIKAVNTPKASAVAVAELTMAFMLALPNRLVEAHNSMKEGKFLKKELKRTELFGKTLGLVGIGNIGHEVAVRARAFGMRVLAYDPYVKKSESALLVASLKELLPQADYVSLHVPLTEETKGLINRQTLALMKNGAYLINTGRGKCVVEEDVAEALRSGKLAGYATDVYASEPPEPDNPLLSAPNTLLTPHIGASSKENLLRIGEEVVKILEDYTGKRA
ncbi:MAG: hydroxyacid dehydrogenase [Thermoanaerobaculum sp.]